MVYCRNIKIFEWSNENERNKLISRLNIHYNNFSYIFKYFNDYNYNNYLVCYIYPKDDDVNNNKFNEKLYNEYHNDYLKYYQKNPDIKLIIITNNKESYLWCKTFFKFFNIFYYYFS